MQAKRVLMGIDGYIDETWSVAKTKNGPTDYILYEKLKDFSLFLSSRDSGGIAANLVKKRRECGGFVGNTAKGLVALGVKPRLIGMFGDGEIDPAFAGLTECDMTSLGAPALCIILEFYDGKIMLAHSDAVQGLTWSGLESAVGREKLAEMVRDSEILALGYWSNMPDFERIIEGLAGLGDSSHELFLDFADIAKRPPGALRSGLEAMRKARALGLKVTISLNIHEANCLAGHFGISSVISQESAASAANATESLKKLTGVDQIAIHAAPYAVSLGESLRIVEAQPIEHPVRSTGAGDMFNAGYIASMAWGLGEKERLEVAMATARSFVGTGSIKCISQNSEMAPEKSWRMLQRRIFPAPRI
ncbi:MAG: PfkB family carbohydrate kinase [Clostridiales bacterium]|jgi:hypothetical protein|nr:PfkB family carbohydrate kinase [Clostridiales bacterium]